MNRLFPTLCIAAVIFIAACKKSADSNSSQKIASDSTMIIGKWTLIHDATYFYTLTGAFVDSFTIAANTQDYYNFNNGILYSYVIDPKANFAYDTATYHIYDNQYLIANYGESDTAKIRFSGDTLALTSIENNTVNPINANPANEYDTVILIRSN